MYGFGRNTRSRNVNIWPGFVDGLATILLVVIFVLLVFLAGQFFLSLRLSGREAQLERLNSQIDELAELLTLERQINADLGLTIGRVSEELRGSQAERDRLAAQVGTLDAERNALDQRLQAALLDIGRLSESQARLTEEREELRATLEARSAERDQLDATRHAHAPAAAAIFSAFSRASSSVPTYMNADSGRSSASPSATRSGSRSSGSRITRSRAGS